MGKKEQLKECWNQKVTFLVCGDFDSILKKAKNDKETFGKEYLILPASLVSGFSDAKVRDYALAYRNRP